MPRQAASQDNLAGKAQQQRGLGTAMQGAFGWLVPRSWRGGKPDANNRPGAQSEAVFPESSNQRVYGHTKPDQHRPAGLELGAQQSSASVSADGASAPDCSMPSSDAARFPQRSLGRASSTGSLGAATNDGHSTASGSSQPARNLSAAAPISVGHSSIAAGDDLCSVATQAGSASHSCNSLQSMMTTTQADIFVEGGSLIGTAPAPAASDRTLLLPSSPTAAGSSNISLLSTYRSSDAGCDGASVSTLPLISELGFDERMQDVQTLAEEHDSQADRKEGSIESGADPSGDMNQAKGRLSSGHGSYSNLTSSSCDLTGPLGPGPAGRIPSPANSRISYSQRNSSKHSLQQQLQQQLLQHPEESQEEGTISTGLPVPFSSRRRPENDDTCSYATQAGSPVHSLSSVMSHWDNQHSQRQQWSSDGNAMLLGAGSSRSLSSYQQQHSSSRSRRTSAETGGHTSGAAAAAASPAQPGASSKAASPVSRVPSAPSGNLAAAQGIRGQVAGDAAHGLQRKSSLKGAFHAVTKWGSGITQRLQRSGSGGSQTFEQQQHSWAAQTSTAAAGRSGLGAPHITPTSSGQELVHWPRDPAH